jgi:uncharacterized membrane protein YhfC
MGKTAYQLIINTFGVGTWLQTLIFYFILLLMLHIILVQLNPSLAKWRFNFFRRWMED